MSEREKHSYRKLIKGGGLALVLIGLFLVVFFIARKQDGAMPPMPKVDVDAKEMALAVERLHHRAESIKVSDWHHDLIEAFKQFNLAEARADDEKTVAQYLKEPRLRGRREKSAISTLEIIWRCNLSRG